MSARAKAIDDFEHHDLSGKLHGFGSEFSDGSISSASSEASVGDHEDYPAMVWDDHASSKGISTFEATVSLITACVGAGIMALPQLPVRVGLYPTVLFTIVCCLGVGDAIGAYYKAYTAYNATHSRSERLRTFEDFGRAAFGRPGAIIIRVAQIGWFMGTSAGYVILVSKQLESIASGTLDLSYRQWIFCVIPVFWFLCMLRDMSALAKLMPLGAATAIASCLLIAVQASRDSERWAEWPLEDQEKLHTYWPHGSLMGLGSGLATLFGAFGLMGNVPPVVDEMKKRRRLPLAVKNSLLFVAMLYLSVIVFGYWGYGNFIQPDIVVSMNKSPRDAAEAFGLPPSKWSAPKSGMLASVMSWCVLVNLSLSYPLLMMCVFVSIQGLSCAQPSLNPGTPKNYLLRTGMVLATMLIALAVDRFDLVYALFGSICGPLASVFIPIIFGAKIRRDIHVKGSSIFRWFFHILIMIVAMFCLVIGFIDSLSNLIENIRS